MPEGGRETMMRPTPCIAELPKGFELLHEPSLNKGISFSAAERDALGLRGLLPPRIFSQAQRVRHVMNNIRRKPNNLHIQSKMYDPTYQEYF